MPEELDGHRILFGILKAKLKEIARLARNPRIQQPRCFSLVVLALSPNEVCPNFRLAGYKQILHGMEPGKAVSIAARRHYPIRPQRTKSLIYLQTEP
jgi:hypothetical protein